MMKIIEPENYNNYHGYKLRINHSIEMVKIIIYLYNYFIKSLVNSLMNISERRGWRKAM